MPLILNEDFWLPIEKKFGFGNGRYNLAFETIDRPCLDGFGDKTALLWVNYKGEEKKFKYSELSSLSNDFSAGLVGAGLKKGERAFIYMEKVPEVYIGILGVIKAGAIACPLFSGFGKNALAERMIDGEAAFVITTDFLRDEVVEISKNIGSLRTIVVHSDRSDRHTIKDDANCKAEVICFNDIYTKNPSFKPCEMQPDECAVIHYTSGTTGKPKGAVHRHMAIMGHYYSTRETFALESDDVYWCTADPGWITGTSHGIFGPWSNGATMVVYEGGFDASKWYETIERFGVSVLYTSPTAIRQLMKEPAAVKKYDLGSLKRIYSVGEPLNPEAIEWSLRNIGLTIYDTWFQTETGAIMITNRPGLDVRKGSMGTPLPGITAMVLDEKGNPAGPGAIGDLVLKPDFPSLFTAYWKKEEIYAARFRNGFYLTGDRACRDEKGYFRFVSRNDDVMKVSGHLLGPFEVESALLELDEIVESAVIGLPDEATGEAPMAFVVFKSGIALDRKLEMKIRAYVRTKVASYAVPKKIKAVEKLPKTRSGKIMRRMLKNLELGLETGDTSTLEE